MVVFVLDKTKGSGSTKAEAADISELESLHKIFRCRLRLSRTPRSSGAGLGHSAGGAGSHAGGAASERGQGQ